MKLWEGRFSRPVDSLMEEFNNSLPIDKRLFEEDIKGSIAWSKALHKANLLTKEETEKLCSGLNDILVSFKNSDVKFIPSDEDIHTAVERILTEKVGDVGAKLHTGRSRNDQVATDFRLYVKKSIMQIQTLIIELQSALVERAKSDKNIIIPGFTHLQQAQPVSFAHYWMSFFYCLQRDKKRLDGAYTTTDIMPLGSGALAGCGFNLDRKFLAKELNFSEISDNSMDAVASRDFALESLNAIGMLAINLSRYAEDLIIWSSKEFSFVELDDAWSTGSSMMPQKKNPDSLELIRGKSGRFIGNMTQLATTLKGLGLTYCKDLQEDKEPLFDSIDQIQLILQVFTHVISTITINKKTIEKDLHPFLLATDIADYLVEKNIPFRQAHHIVGKIVGDCVRDNKSLSDITVDEYKKYSNVFDDDVKLIFKWETALEHRSIQGGTGMNSINNQISKADKIIKSYLNK